MLELVNQLDGFDARGNIKVLMATNRPDTLDPALKRPGRLDRKVEFALPDLEGRTQIFKIHARPMTCERGIRCWLGYVQTQPELRFGAFVQKQVCLLFVHVVKQSQRKTS